MIIMRKCNCGRINNDESKFCSSCGCELTETNSEHIPDNYGPMQKDAYINPPMIPHTHTNSTKPPITIFDIMTIFSFVSSIVGCFCIALVFEPAAIITGLLGFKKGKRYKALAVSGIIISIISFIIQLFIALYRNNIINKWFIEGIFH